MSSPYRSELSGILVAMYDKVGSISSPVCKKLLSVAKKADWKVVKGSGRDYLTSFCGDDVKDLFDWDHWQSAFFLRIPPGGMVHPHTDVNHPWNTYHVVVKTNSKAVSYSSEGEVKPQVRGIYRVNRQIEHWAVNNGRTDRIHLLCEVYE